MVTLSCNTSDVLILSLFSPLWQATRKSFETLSRYYFNMQFSRYMLCASHYCEASVPKPSAFARANGDGEIRTLDPLLARQVLSQLSYTPMFCNQLFSILITCLHAIMPSMIPMHVTPLKRCGSTLIKGDPIFTSFIILNSAVYPVSMLFSFHGITLSGNGLKWTRTTDLTLIRRAL